MNIFVVDANPDTAARQVCDQHTTKMPVETAQMLATALHLLRRGDQWLWRPAYQAHPCTRWVRASKANFEWTLAHGFGLCDEYERRFGRLHAAHDQLLIVSSLASLMPDTEWPQLDHTPHAQAMPDTHKRPCAVEAYRSYYRSKTWARWRYTMRPTWLEE
jgi:hypothetical protein